MSQRPDSIRLRAAYDKVRQVLLERRTPGGHWVGRLSDSALSTATAVSAFSVFYDTIRNTDAPKHDLTAEEFLHLETLMPKSVDWLVAHQNLDGGWGDTDKSFSNVSTTLLVKSALVLATNTSRERNEVERPDKPVKQSGYSAVLRSRLSNADEYLHRSGGIEAIKKRYGKDQTFSVPILTNAALAGLVDWKTIPQLPFELAALPMSWFRFAKMNVVSYAIPALVAIGQVRFQFFQEKGRFIGNFVRRLVRKRTLRLIEKMQPESGGYLEAAPLTAFVVMSLSAMGLTDHPIVTKGIRFLLNSIREDGAVPIDTNLATWVTTLSVNALGKEAFTAEESERLVDWILSCQHTQRHPFTGALPGGWGWTNLSGAVPDADDTAGAMLALQELLPNIQEKEKQKTILNALYNGKLWLCRLQNRDGGMPTFCRGWGMLPFDKSSTDLTAHAMRVWSDGVMKEAFLKRAVRFLERSQQGYKDWKVRTGTVVSTASHGEVVELTPPFQPSEGSWLPLWFGNQHQPDDANPFYGTAKVLLALTTPWVRSCFHSYPFAIVRGYDFLIKNQNPDGSWGGVQGKGSVEETAVVVEALAACARAGGVSPPVIQAYHRGLNWLLEAVESDRFLEASPIGLYFAKLWYYEDLYPIIFTASALRRALQTI